jgi:hypothetical protein
MEEGATLGNALETKSPLLDRVGRMIDRLQRSIRQITKELQRLQAARVKAQRAACIPPRSYPTEQSQFLSEIQRRDPDFDDLDE